MYSLAAPPFAEHGFEEARDVAGRENKLVLLFFSKIDDDQSNGYRQATWLDDEVKTWIEERAVAIEVSTNEMSRLSSRFDVETLPTVLLVSPSGSTRARISGYRGPRRFISEMNQRLRASDPLALARERFDTSADQPSAALAFARELERIGRIDEALAQYVNAFEGRGAAITSYGGIQMLVLDEVGRLAATNDAANAVLVRWRDESRRRLITGKPQRTDPAILVTADMQLDALPDALSAYQVVSDQYPRQPTTRLLRASIVRGAIDARAYSTVVKLVNPVEQIGQAHQLYQNDSNRPIPPDVDADNYRAFVRRTFVDRTIGYYEVLIGTGHADEASTVASMLLAVDGRPTTYHALAQAGARTGQPTLDNVAQASYAVEHTTPISLETLSTLVRIHTLRKETEDASRIVELYAPKLATQRDRNTLRQCLADKAPTSPIAP